MANKKQNFGDIIENHDLVKRTLMVSAFPALVKEVEKEGEKFFSGFLPGFEFAEVDDIETEDELVETLQDMLDDEVEELVVFGKSLPNLPEDEELLKKNKGYKIVYLDINVYASKDELDYYDCAHDCSSCGGHCFDEECDCGNEDFHDHCDCGCEDEDYDIDEDDCDCGCHHEHNHNKNENENKGKCDCGKKEHKKECDCASGKPKKNCRKAAKKK